MNKKEKERNKKSKLGKLVLCVVLSLLVLIVSSSVVFANGNGNNSVNVKINGQELQGDTSAFIDKNSGTSLVPFRIIFETLGANVKWDQQTQTIIANKGNILIRLKINDNYMFVNNTPKDIKIRPVIISGHTFVPLRVVSEALGADVNWDEITSTVTISSNDVNSNTNNPIINTTKENSNNKGEDIMPTNDSIVEKLNDNTISNENIIDNEDNTTDSNKNKYDKNGFLIPINPNE